LGGLGKEGKGMPECQKNQEGIGHTQGRGGSQRGRKGKHYVYLGGEIAYNLGNRRERAERNASVPPPFLTFLTGYGNSLDGFEKGNQRGEKRGEGCSATVQCGVICPWQKGKKGCELLRKKARGRKFKKGERPSAGTEKTPMPKKK